MPPLRPTQMPLGMTDDAAHQAWVFADTGGGGRADDCSVRCGYGTLGVQKTATQRIFSNQELAAHAVHPNC